MHSFGLYVSICLLILNSITGSAPFETVELRSRFVRQLDDKGNGQMDQCVEKSAPQIMEEIPDSKTAESLRIRVAAKKTPEPVTPAPSPTPGTVKILGPEVGFFRSVTNHLHEIAEKEHTAAKEREAEKVAPKGGKKKDPKVGTPKSVEKVTFKPTLFIKSKKPDLKLKPKELKSPLHIKIGKNKDRIGTTSKIMSIKQRRVPDSLASSSRLGKPIVPNHKSNEIRKIPIVESIGTPALIARPPPGFTDYYNRNRKSKFGSPNINKMQAIDVEDSMVSATNHNEEIIKVPTNFVEKSSSNDVQSKLFGEENIMKNIEPSYESDLREVGDKKDSDNVTACSYIIPVGKATQSLENANIHDTAAKEDSNDFKKSENTELAMNNDEALKQLLENPSNISNNVLPSEETVTPTREVIGSESQDIYSNDMSEVDKATVGVMNLVENTESDNISLKSKHDNTNLSNVKTDMNNVSSKIIKDNNGIKKKLIVKKPVSLDDIRKLIKLKKLEFKPQLQGMKNKPETTPRENCVIPPIDAIEPTNTIDVDSMPSESINDDTKVFMSNTNERNALTKNKIVKKPVSLVNLQKLMKSKHFKHRPKLLAREREPDILPIDNLKLQSQDTSCKIPQVTESSSFLNNIPLESIKNSTKVLRNNKVNTADRKTVSKTTKDYDDSKSKVIKNPLSLNRLRKLIKSKRLYLEPHLQVAESEPISETNDNIKLDSQDIHHGISQEEAKESIKNTVPDNILSESINYETNLPNKIVDTFARNGLSKTRKKLVGSTKSTIGEKSISLSDIRKLIKSKTLGLTPKFSPTFDPHCVASDNSELKFQLNTEDAASSSLSKPLKSPNDEIILSNPTIPTAGEKSLSKATKDYSKMLKIPLIKKSLSLANIKKFTKPTKHAVIPKNNVQDKAAISSKISKTLRIQTSNKEGTVKSTQSTQEKAVNENSNTVNEIENEKLKLGDPRSIVSLDSDTSASNVEARTETHMPLGSTAKDVEKNTLPCIETIREFIQLKKNRLALQASNPLNSNIGKDKIKKKSNKNYIIGADNTFEASAINPKQANKDIPKEEIVTPIPKIPYEVEGSMPQIHNLEITRELGKESKKLKVKNNNKIKPLSLIPEKLGILKKETKDITDSIDRKAGDPENIISKALVHSLKEDFKKNRNNGQVITPHSSLNNPVKLDLVRSGAQNFRDEIKDSHNVMKSEKSPIRPRDKSKVIALNSAQNNKRLHRYKTEKNDECVINKKLGTQKNILNNIDPTAKIETDPISEASDNIQMTKESEPFKSMLVKDLIKTKLLRLAQKHTDKSVITYPSIKDDNDCEKAAAILPSDDEESAVLEPKDLLESVTQKCISPSHKILGNIPLIFDKSKENISKVQEDKDCEMAERSLKKLGENSKFVSIPLGSSDPVTKVAPNFKAALASVKRKSTLFKSEPLLTTDVTSKRERKFKDFRSRPSIKLDIQDTQKTADEKSLSKTEFPQESVQDNDEIGAESKKSDDLISSSSSNEPTILELKSPTSKTKDTYITDAKKSLDTMRDFLKSKKKKQESLRLSKEIDKSKIKLGASEPKPNVAPRKNDMSVLRKIYPLPAGDKCISPALGSELDKNDLARFKSGKFMLECRLTPKNSEDFR